MSEKQSVRAKLFANLRGGSMFAHGFTQQQVSGLDNLLDVWDGWYAADPIDLLAYNLATAFHETAGTMQPIKERGPVRYFDKYEPGTKIGKVLGNTKKGDGYRFRGEGHVQNTGRRNAAYASKRLNEVFGLDVDLVKDPGKRGDPFISAHSLFLGNKEGWWTGKDLLDFLDGEDEDDAEDLREFINARRVVNGTDKATKIAHYAIEFEHALRSAGYGAARPVPAPAPVKPAPVQVPQPQVSTAAPRPGVPAAFAAMLALTAAAWGVLEGLPCQWLGLFCGVTQ